MKSLTRSWRSIRRLGCRCCFRCRGPRRACRKRRPKAPRSSKPKKGAGRGQLTEALKTRLFDLRKAGFNRLYQAGDVFEFSTPESLLDINFELPVFVLVDRLVVSAEARTRVVDAIETAYRESGEVIFEIAESGS